MKTALRLSVPVILSILAFGASAPLTFAETFTVDLSSSTSTCVSITDSTCNSIQSAVTAAAVSDDTINVAAGDYTGNLTIDKSLTLIGAGDTTVINGGVDSNGANVTIQDLKITNQNPNSGTFYYGVKASANNILTLENVTIDVLYYGIRMGKNDPSTSAVITINNSRIKGYAAIHFNGSNDAGAVVNTGTVINVFNSSLIGTTSYDDSGSNDFAVIALAYTSGAHINFSGTSSVANEFTGGALAKENLILFYFDADNNSVTGTPTYINAVNSTINAVDLFESAYGPYTNTVEGQVVSRYVQDTTEFEAALASDAMTPIVIGRGDIPGITTTKDNTLKAGVTLLVGANNTPTTIASGTTLVNNGTIIVETGATFINNGTISGNGTTATITTSGSEVSATLLNAVTQTGTDDDVTVTVEIPNGTVITGDSTWNGVISPPTATTETVTVSGYDTTVTSAITVGSGESDLIFDKAVKLTFAGQAGTLVGYYNHAGTFATIAACSTINVGPYDQAWADNVANLAVGADCTFDSGSDLVVWTKHFSSFVTYTQTAVVVPPTPGHGGGNACGLGFTFNPSTLGCDRATPAVPANVTTPDGCAPGNKFSTTTGRNCNAATPATGQGQVLGASTFNFTRNLGVGLSGEDVTALQQILIDAGLLKINAPTGNFGQLTKAAVQAFQKSRGVSQTGFVGPLTRAELNKGSAGVGSGVTVEQMNSILGVLQSFDVDQATLDKVRAALSR